MKQNQLKKTASLLILFLITTWFSSRAQNLVIHYGLTNDVAGSTQVIDETNNGYSGALLNGAKISTWQGTPVIDLGGANGYVDLGENFGTAVSSLNDFSIVAKVLIPSIYIVSGNGNFIWAFANSNNLGSDANGGLFLSAVNMRYAITATNYSSESGFTTGSALPKGSWQTIIYTQKDGKGSLYLNGDILKTGTITMTPSELGKTAFNYLGRSSYSGDNYLPQAKFSDFRVYDDALSSNDIATISGKEIETTSANLLVKYDFSSTSDTSNTYAGSLESGATLAEYGQYNMVDLGDDNGYFDLGSDLGQVIGKLDSFSISTNLYIPATTTLSSGGYFVWTFANSLDIASTQNGNIFFSAYQERFKISKTHWSGESGVSAGTDLPTGQWVNVTYTQLNGSGKIYIDGSLVAQGSPATMPSEVGNTAYNLLGRSCYSGDAYLTGARYQSFLIYEGALGEDEIADLCYDLTGLNNINDSITLADAISTIEIEDTVQSSLILPTVVGNEVSVAWTSSNTDVISNKGLVSQPAVGSEAILVTLTGVYSYHDVSIEKTYTVTVLPKLTDAASIAYDIEHLELTGKTDNIRESITLPITTEQGSKIVWESASPEVLNNVGKVVQRPANGEGKQMVTLTATLTKGEEMATKSFDVSVAEDEGFSAYLFSYFTGNTTDGEQIRFAVSNDGYTYSPLNNGNRIISSDTISLKGGVRDPHILRGEDGKSFYMVVTDMKSAEGWSSNRGMVLLKSTDLVTWTHATVHFPSRYPSTWANVLRVWAPQTIYDPVAGKYLVYYSLYTGDETAPYDRIYYNYANEDFTDLEGEPKLLYDRGTATIDCDIVFNEVDGLYHMVFKNETLGGISQVTSKTIVNPEGTEPSSQWGPASKTLQQTTEAVEGAGVFRLFNSENWVLMYDCYGSGHYQYCSSDDLENFTYVRDDYSINARHGTTIPITEEEAQRLYTKWPSTSFSIIPQGARNASVRETGVRVNSTAKTMKIGVQYGTDLSAFDPQVYGAPGAVITPQGEQNFENGPVTYTFSLRGITVKYEVSVAVEANPVIPDFHADPEILYSKNTGRFYLYPTTDGYSGWGGYSFDVFSSPDLVNWTNEGTFLDLSTSQVSWATGNAWAPCIEEVQTGDDSYNYYFYFSGNAGSKKIGVAVANSPTGPFIDMGSPMIDTNPSGASGQIIDGDVFTDPVSGKSYFYYGNAYMAVAELNDDMVSIKEGTTKVITPTGGSLSTYAYREGAYVFYRNGLYYFLWSVDDTGAANYHVAYGTSTSPTGPIQVADSPIVIIQDASESIYGTGHNSILQIPGKDEWYIVYHRINADYINSDPGIHREVCIDKLEFNTDGTIKQVTPTRKGIDPVSLDPATAINDVTTDPEFKTTAKLISSKTYDLTGRMIDPAKAVESLQFYIQVNEYADGTITTKKYINHQY